MKHQIMHLLMAILLFAGIATSATKADEIEGTWSQEGQYKKFSKEYTDLKLFEVSADGTKIAIVTDSTLRIFDIESGLIQTKLTIPDISNYAHSPYCISKDLNYFGLSQSDYSNDGGKIDFNIRAKVLNVANNTLILDTIMNYSYYETEAYPEVETKNYFCSSNTFYLHFSIYTGRWYRRSKHFNLIFDCTNNTSKIDYQAHPYNTMYVGNKNNILVGYYNQVFIDDISGSASSNYRFHKELFMQKDSNNIIIASESWEYRSDEPEPPHSGFCPNPIGITGDDKMFMTQSGVEYIFYDLDSIGKNHRIDSAFSKYPVMAVLFPNINNRKSFMTIHQADLGNVKISERSYIDGSQLASYEVYGNHFRNYGSIFRLIDSSRIIICEDTPSKKIYILDLNLKTDYPVLDIISDVQSGTTNDTVKFSIKCPATHRDIIVDYGDGSSDSEYPYHHVYSKPGTYSVQINALNKDNVYEAFKRKDYINISQGLELSFDVFHYCMPDNIQIKIINTSTGNHENQSITVAPLSDLANAREIKGKDTLIAYFTEYVKYKITISAFDSDRGKIYRKDSIIDINKNSSPNISFEKYLGLKLETNIALYENFNTIDLISFQNDFYDHSRISTVTINNDDQLSNITKLYCYFFWHSINKTSPKHYAIDGSIYDISTGIKDTNRIDCLYCKFHCFAYNDSLYAIMAYDDEVLSALEIRLYSSTAYKFVKNISLKNYGFSWKDATITLATSKGIVYVLNPYTTDKLNCFVIDSKNNRVSLKTFNYNLDKAYPYINYYNKYKIICQPSDDVLLLPIGNKIIRLNLSNSEVDSVTIGENNIEGLCAIKDNMIAVITRNKEMETVIKLTDNNFTVLKTIILPKREDVIQYCNITPDNQLRIIYSTKYRDLYLCRVPILDIASSSVAESKSEEEPLVFPNPASNSISIQFPLSPIATIRIVDETGKAYSTKISSANTDDFSIDTSLLPDGTYFVQIQDGEINKSVKFIIKR